MSFGLITAFTLLPGGATDVTAAGVPIGPVDPIYSTGPVELTDASGATYRFTPSLDGVELAVFVYAEDPDGGDAAVGSHISAPAGFPGTIESTSPEGTPTEINAEARLFVADPAPTDDTPPSIGYCTDTSAVVIGGTELRGWDCANEFTAPADPGAAAADDGARMSENLPETEATRIVSAIRESLPVIRVIFAPIDCTVNYHPDGTTEVIGDATTCSVGA